MLHALTKVFPYPPLYHPFKLVSGSVALRLQHSRITPNAITTLWALSLMLSGYALSLDARLIAFLLVLFAIFLDCLDGDLARVRRQSSESGTMVEQIAHWIGNMSIVAGAGAAIQLQYPGVYSVTLSAVICVAQAVYIAVVRQIRGEPIGGIDVQRSKRVFLTVTRTNYLLSPIELPLVAFFVIFGLSPETVFIASGLLLLSSTLIFIPHYFIILPIDQGRWKLESSQDFPGLSVREADKLLSSTFKNIHWYTPTSSKLSPQVLSMGATQPMYHRSDEFEKIWHDLHEDLPTIFRTRGRVLSLSCSGIGAMEATVSNIVNPKDRVMVIIDSPNSFQWKAIAERFGAEVVQYEIPFGLPIDLRSFENFMATQHPVKAVFATLSDSTHGGIQDIASIGRCVDGSGALFIVDVILGLAADDFRMDEWAVDIAVGTSDCGLMAPSGLGLVALNQQMVERFQNGTAFSRNAQFYWEFGPYLGCLERPRFAVPTQVASALYLSARMILSVGLDRILNHRQEVAWGFRRGCTDVLDLPILAANPSAACTTVKLPHDIKASVLQALLRDKYSISITTGMTPNGDETLRIVHTGWLFRDDIYSVIHALALSFLSIRNTNS